MFGHFCPIFTLFVFNYTGLPQQYKIILYIFWRTFTMQERPGKARPFHAGGMFPKG
jgi:hypothetical protein